MENAGLSSELIEAVERNEGLRKDIKGRIHENLADIKHLPIIRRFLEKPHYRVSNMVNERDNKDISVLRPLYKEGMESESFQPLFSYLSRTKDIEVNTSKTNHLQEIADRMTKGFDFKTRIVVMKKGKGITAFVTPDGTIFLSQAVINTLDTEDEIGAVIAHEINHIRNKTFETSNKTWNKLGVGWVQEVAADAQAPGLLEKANLNSMAFASAIEKISAFERGVIHQGGLTRSSQNIAIHYGIHYKTSIKEPTPKSKILDGDAKPTNMELFEEAYEEHDRKKSSEILEKLHPYDLLNAHNKLAALRESEIRVDKVKEIKENEKEIAVFAKAASEIRKILAGKDATPDEQTILLMCLHPYREEGKSDKYRRFNEIRKDPRKIVDLAKLLSDDQSIARLNKIYGEAFGKRYLNMPGLFVKNLEDNLVDQTATPGARGIPVDEKSVLETLAMVRYPEEGYFKDEDVSRVIMEYIKRTNSQFITEKSKFNEAKVCAFLEKVRDKKIFDNEFKHEISFKFLDNFRDHAGNLYTFPNDARNKTYALTEEILGSKEQLFTEKDITPFFEKIKKETFWDASSDFEKFGNWAGYSLQDSSEDLKLRVARKIVAEIATFPQFAQWYGKPPEVDYKKLTDEEKKIFTQQGLLLHGISLAAKIFRKDSDEFYDFMNGLADKYLSPDLSSEEAFSISKSLLESNSIDFLVPKGKRGIKKYIAATKISRLDKFSELAVIKRAREYRAAQNITTLNELSDKLTGKPDIFEDKMPDLIEGQGYRQKFLELGKKDTPISSFEALHECLRSAYPRGPERTFFLRQINKKIMVSQQISFEKKLEYLKGHLDEMGAEGLSLLAEQIEDFNTYGEFRKQMEKEIDKYKSGESITFAIAAADYVSSFFSKNFKHVFELSKTDPESQQKNSTLFAEKWIIYHTNAGGPSSLGINYDFDSGKFLLSSQGKQIFHTVSELIDTLHNLTPFQRFAIAQKLLTEKDGALSSVENRKILSQQIIESLNIKDPFVVESIKVACEKGEAKFLVFPASQMIGEILFRGLNKEAIDRDKIGEMEIMHPDDLDKDKQRTAKVKNLPPDIMRSLSTGRRDVSIFGSGFRSYPDSFFYKLSKKSDEEFYQLTRQLHELLDDNPEEVKESKVVKLDPSVEGPIKALSLNALGVRSMQLVTQMYEFSEPLRKRLSESFDSNPGINKLLFWENLFKIAGDDTKAKEFIEQISLKDKAGAGSIYTTWKGEIEEDGIKKEIVIKMLNPNAEAFLKQGRSLATTVLEEVGKKGGKTKKLADMCLLLTDLSCQWSLKDINDYLKFEADDDNFKEKVVKTYNEVTGAEKFIVPERKYNSYELKAEEFIHGGTVNKILNDEKVSFEEKRKVVKKMSDFFAYQLKCPNKIIEEGKEYAIVWSDPHVGNHISDLEKEGHPVGVVDRHMYLKLEEADREVIKEFILGNDEKFLSAFTQRILDINNVTNRIERSVISGRIKAGIMSNYLSQRSHGSVDSFSLLRTALEKFSERGLDIPLNLRLMIRNVQSFKNLTEAYGLNFEEIYKNLDASK